MRGVRGWFATGLCIAIALLTTGRALQAQVDPRGSVETIRTEHFRVHFATGNELLARRAAAFAETAWVQLANELAPPDAPVELLVADNLDLSNGYATTFPTNRIVVFSMPPIAVPELRVNDDWLQRVITHELAHIFHLDRARGLWSVGRKLFGRNPALVPNSFLPSWMIEGLAVHYETSLTGSGRLASSGFPMIARTAAQQNALHGPDAWSLTSSRFPLGQLAYGYGSMLMSQMASRTRDDGTTAGMRDFVDAVAIHPLPYRLDRSARLGFGVSIGDAFEQYRDSVRGSLDAIDRWAALDTMPRLVANGMEWFAEMPRWESDSTLVLAVNNGRDVSGVYRARVLAMRRDGTVGTTPFAITLERIARRNTLDANVPYDSTLVFAQLEYDDPYLLRSRLYARDAKENESVLAGTERLMYPDVRASDGAVIAVRVLPGTAELVRLQPDGTVHTFAAASLDTIWSEPRWSPDGARVVAVRMLSGATQEIVVLDSTGRVQHVVHSARAIATMPGFTANGEQVVWATDLLGNMQLAVASATPCADACEPRYLTTSRTGVTAPAVSPDGARVAALEYTQRGWRLIVLPMHAGYALSDTDPAQRLPTSTPYALESRAPVVTPDSSAATPYNTLRQLWPRWWTPVVGQGSDGATVYGGATSGADILRRQAWFVSATWHPTRHELEGNAAWRYSNLPRVGSWQPTLDVSGVQQWARFDINDTLGGIIGELQRQSRYLTLSTSFSRPRVRHVASATVGAQLETRGYGTTPDSLLGGLERIYQRGRKSPSVFVSGSWGNTMRAGRAISSENGVSLSGTLAHAWRSGTEELRSWRATGVARGYRALGSGSSAGGVFGADFARQVLAVRVSGGLTDQNAGTELSIGGISGTRAELVPGVMVGDPSRLFPVRGFAPGVQRGTQVVSGTVEHRLPLAMVARGVGLLPMFLDRVSFNSFVDAGRATCGAGVRASRAGASLCERGSARDGWLVSAGGELHLDLGVSWDTPWRARLGVAQPFMRPSAISGATSMYFTLGTSF